MFDRLRKLVKRSRPFLQTNALSPPTEKPDYVTDPVRILRILKDLQKRHVVLMVRVPGVHRPFVSSLLDIEKTNGLIILDELNPVSGNVLAAERKRLKVEALLRGVMVCFSLMILSIEGENGIALYKASLPDEVYYPQRRKSTRITLHSTINIPFQATMAGEATLFHGRLTNLSLGGLAFFIPFSEALTLGDELRDCKITLPDGEDIQFMFSVRYVKSLPRENKTVIGGCFTAIGYEDYKAIERYLDAFVSDRLGTT